MNRGFTIIETFVAITILLVAVLGPLSILARAIGDESYLKNQLISAYLAQEGLELAINTKDNNMVLLNVPPPGNPSPDWLEGLSCEQGCEIKKSQGEITFVGKGGTPGGDFGKICLSGAGYGDCDGGGESTPFKRVITVTNIEDYADIVSVVTWVQKGVLRTVELSSTVYKYERNTF